MAKLPWCLSQVIAELDEKKREALEKTWRKVNQVHVALSGVTPAALLNPSSCHQLPMHSRTPLFAHCSVVCASATGVRTRGGQHQTGIGSISVSLGLHKAARDGSGTEAAAALRRTLGPSSRCCCRARQPSWSRPRTAPSWTVRGTSTLQEPFAGNSCFARTGMQNHFGRRGTAVWAAVEAGCCSCS